MAPEKIGGVRSVVTRRRLLWGSIAALFLPILLVVALSQQPRPEPPPEPNPQQFAVLAQVPPVEAQAQFERSTAANKLAPKLTAPTLVPAAQLRSRPEAGTLPSLVVPPRPAPYTLAELQKTVPTAFGPVTPGQPLQVLAHVEVPLGATLVIDDSTPDLQLVSSPAGFATIMSRGTVTVTGTQQVPIQIASFDQRVNGVDTQVTDGRPYVLQSGGRMDVTWARFDSLGFGTGTTSGVAWVGTGGNATVADSATNRATGTVTNSLFTRNQFGAYTHEAQGMQFSGNTFSNNIEYGFDPHDFSNNFVVDGNTADHNGKHGFIFSRGCQGNVMSNNSSFANVGHGFMIDDGRSQATQNAEARVSPSNNNTITGNSAANNGGMGVAIEGGQGNVVSNNTLDANYIGVRTKNNATASITGNTITNSGRYGIDVMDPNNRVQVNGNTISGSWGAINLAQPASAVVGANTISDVNTPLVVNKVAERPTAWYDDVLNFIRWNPMLLIWSWVIGLPLIVGVVHLIGYLPRQVLRRRTAVHS